ncbi:hypothetical protein V1525DRAFT_385932 [Lipomyces kononenkoae]|uniref:Uncharacterized protein n=1 Tax=Lipomyces kononenkoae TaxID=34357 RepID=A0ACC3T8J2_LIPKO
MRLRSGNIASLVPPPTTTTIIVSRGDMVGFGNNSSLPTNSYSLPPSHVGQSLEQSAPSVTVNEDNQKEITTVVKEVTEVYSRLSSAHLLPPAPETFGLLKELRGVDATFKSQYQAAAVQTIISNPGDSHLVVLPTGGGESDICVSL